MSNLLTEDATKVTVTTESGQRLVSKDDAREMEKKKPGTIVEDQKPSVDDPNAGRPQEPPVND